MHHYGDFFTATIGDTMSKSKSHDETMIFTRDVKTGMFQRPIKVPEGFSALPDGIQRIVEKMSLHPDENDWWWSGDWFVVRIWEDADHFQILATQVEFSSDVKKVSR